MSYTNNKRSGMEVESMTHKRIELNNNQDEMEVLNDNAPRVNSLSSANSRRNLPLYYQLAVLFRTHTKIGVVCTSYSIVYRVIICCELLLKGYIRCVNSPGSKQPKFIIDKIPNDPILAEFANKISLIINRENNSITPKRIIKILNGESISNIDRSKSISIANNYSRASKCTVKKLKSKIYKILVKDKVVERERKFICFSTTILFKDNNLWNEIFNTLMNEIRQCSIEKNCVKTNENCNLSNYDISSNSSLFDKINEFSNNPNGLGIHCTIILLSLNYIDGGNSLMDQLNLEDKFLLRKAIGNSAEIIKDNSLSINSKFPLRDLMIGEFLKLICIY